MYGILIESVIEFNLILKILRKLSLANFRSKFKSLSLTYFFNSPERYANALRKNSDWPCGKKSKII